MGWRRRIYSSNSNSLRYLPHSYAEPTTRDLPVANQLIANPLDQIDRDSKAGAGFDDVRIKRVVRFAD